MTDPAFELEDASEILVSIGGLVLGDPEYLDTRWSAFTLVVNLDRGESMYGYAYAEDGSWKGASPGGFDVLDRAIQLRAAMSVPGKRDWKLCRIQVTRGDHQITVDFEYKSAKRWRVTPANVYEMAESLRPHRLIVPASHVSRRTSARWWQRRRIPH
ncbi:hypothetical protein [Nocardia concava]|uniref:hypothetical protein n=1 Tax=Nocardia concava TaxID=257281 RepID=UPI0012FC220C|nr:hypothetical protein [Nocardia concava]